LVVPFSLIVFLVGVGDSLMSYIAPIYIESHVADSGVMGIIIALSSLVGIFCDFTFSRIFKNKSHVFFFKTALIFALSYPILFLTLPPYYPVFVLGMIAWGIYYELLQFADINFVDTQVPKSHYANAWGILSSFRATAYFIGPVVAGLLLSLGQTSYVFVTAICFHLMAAFALTIFHRLAKSTPPIQPASNNGSILLELDAWFILFKKVWPVYFFLFLLFLVDSTYWTVGTLVSQDLLKSHSSGAFFLSAYSLPGLFMGLLLSRFGSPTGKKHLAFVMAMLSGIVLLGVGFVSHPLVILLLIFCSSMFLAVSFPEIFAVFEDYINRLGSSKNDMIGLQSSAISLAYIVGPIVSGFLATIVGNQMVFTLLGVLLIAYSAFSLHLVPKKVHFPQQELQSLQS